MVNEVGENYADGNNVSNLSDLNATQFKGNEGERNEQLSAIEARLDELLNRISGMPPPDGFALSYAAPSDAERALIRQPRAALPDPRLVRRLIRQRQLRSQFFESELFADPAWDMLLDLTAARAEHRRISVTSLCIASGVPGSTALRWISILVDGGLAERIEDDTDKRRAFITLTDRAAEAMARFFQEVGKQATKMV
jgi:DNA-binding transcriptional ArsR family regulator